MENLMVLIHDVETGEIIKREMNDEEILQLENAEIKKQEATQAEAAKAAEKAALLEKLGITEDEAKLLLS